MNLTRKKITGFHFLECDILPRPATGTEMTFVAEYRFRNAASEWKPREQWRVRCVRQNRYRSEEMRVASDVGLLHRIPPPNTVWCCCSTEIHCFVDNLCICVTFNSQPTESIFVLRHRCHYLDSAANNTICFVYY